MKKVVMQLVVLSLKPITAEKKAQGLVGDEYEKAKKGLQGQNHEGFQVQNSTTNADTPPHVLASFDVSNAFLNAELSEDVLTLIVKPGTLHQCTKACHGKREAPELWEEARDKTLCLPD